MVEGKRARRILWLGALAAMAAGCPGPRAPAERTVVTASGEVPYPTDFTPPPPLAPPPAADPRALGARYLDLVHLRIGDGWTAFLEDCRLRLPPSHPLNSPTLVATAGLTVDVQGNVLEVTLLRPSGNPDFDDVVRAVATDAGPFPPPERALLSDDDRVYLTWSFARDERQAGAATASLRRIEWSLDRAVPRFLAERNLAEAARRVAAAAPAASGAARDQVLELGERVMAAAVREGLGASDLGVQRLAIDAAAAARLAPAARELRSIADGALDVGQRAAAIAALAEVGDRDAAPMLVTILERDQGANVELTGAAGRALDRLGQRERLGQLVTGWFDAGRAGKTAADRARLWAALIAAGQAPVPATIPDIARMQASAEPVVRAAACRALGAAVVVDRRAWPGLRKGVGDADASVRAACVGAIAAAAGAGAKDRATFWQLTPRLKDRDERVRAAAVLAVVRLEPARAGAELGVVSRDRSPVVLASLAEAWVRTGGAARAVALLDHEDAAVRLAAAGALATADDAARAALAARPELAPPLRVLALGVTTDRAAVEAASTDPDPAVRAAATHRMVALRGRAETLADVATQLAAAPPASAERVRLAAAWLAAR